ncbi:MAG: hypothetical protein RBS77_03880 [Candidatus Moranbacteria bacterium]|jgi:hypothetical protein|nr:hypothetical protein [Candidatus Moranbacteria bacterium]
MAENIRKFLLEGGNIDTFLMLIAAVLLGAIFSLGYGLIQRRKFISAWMNTLDAIVEELNSKGETIANTLIEIAMISADAVTARKIGIIEKDVINYKDGPTFYSKLSSIIEDINDNNHTAVLNSDYAAARNAIKEAIALTEKFSQVRSFEDFSSLSIEVNDAKKGIAQATTNLAGILYGLKPQQSLAVEEKE